MKVHRQIKIESANFFVLLVSIIMVFNYGVPVMNGQPDDINVPTGFSCGRIALHESESHIINIDRSTVSALFFINWTNSTSKLKLELTAPNGSIMSQIGGKYSKGKTFESYFVSTSEKGNWTAEIRASDVPENGEDYCLLTVLNKVSEGASFNRLYSDNGIDKDENGQYDMIMVKVGIKVLSPGEYKLVGVLRDLNDTDISANNSTHLNFGTKFMNLEFGGSKSKGQRTLINLTLYDAAGEILDHMEKAYITKAYDNMNPEVKMNLVSGPAKLTDSFADHGTDVNGDGLYDYLTVDVGVDVLTPGVYTLSGNLFDLGGKEIVWSIDQVNLSAGSHKMQINFDGKTIQKSGVNGPYKLKGTLAGENWSMVDIISDEYITQAYNSSDFVDPVRSNEILSGYGFGELLITFTLKEVLPVFSGKYSQDIVGLNVPPIISPNWTIDVSEQGYSSHFPGIYMPAKPNNFTVSAHGVKNLNIGLRKDPMPILGYTYSRTWMSSQIPSKNGQASADTDRISPGSYHIKIFGDAENNTSQVDLTLTSVKKVVAKGKFSLSINTTGFPAGNYSIAAKAINGSFSFDKLNLDGLSMT